MQSAGLGFGLFIALGLVGLVISRQHFGQMAEREAAKAAEELRRVREQEEKQKAVMAEFHRPPERTPEQLMHFVMQLVNHAAEAGQRTGRPGVRADQDPS